MASFIVLEPKLQRLDEGGLPMWGGCIHGVWGNQAKP
jgi:hypothetical protein